MGVVENGLLFNWVFPLLLVPDGIAESFEVDGTACVLPAFQYVDNGAVAPAVGIFRLRVRSFAPLLLFIGSRRQHLIRFELVGDLLWASPLHAHREDTLYHISGFRVDHPSFGVLRVFHIAIRNIDGQRYAALTLCLCHSPDFPAGITGVKLVKPVLDSGKIVVDAVGVSGVEIVVDGNEACSILRKGEVGVKPGQRGVSSKTGEVFRDGNRHIPGFNLGKHGLKSGSVESHTRNAVIHKKGRVWEMMLACILE